MLARLLVENLTVIDKAEVALSEGLTIVSGETGAGKTMLTQAVRLVAGEKADGRLVGPRRDEAYVEAEFTDPAPDALSDVADPDEPLVLGRRLRRDGPTRALCSGRSCSADQLRAAAGELVSLTGQHAARRLTDAAVQLDLVDRAGDLHSQRGELASLFKAWKDAERDLATLREALADRVRRLEMLRHEVSTVRELDPQPGEPDELGAERERLRHVEELRHATLLAAEGLNGDEDGIADRIAMVMRELDGVAAHDENVAQLLSDVTDAAERLSDASREARALADSYDSDPGRLEEVETRLSALNDLRRRYAGLDIADILQRVDESERELAQLEGGDELLSQLETAAADARSAYAAAADQLTSARRAAAKTLVRATEQHLHDLGLPSAKFVVELSPAEPSARGADRVTMLLQANRGLEPAPLDKGASGGELSRVNLALLLAAKPDAGTWVFDEVDAGIGGDTAHVVAAKLKELARHAQVIVVTHLAQIAVQADQHLVVRKDDSGEVTRTYITELTEEGERERELARLIGADADDEQAAKTAADLVRAAAAR